MAIKALMKKQMKTVSISKKMVILIAVSMFILFCTSLCYGAIAETTDKTRLLVVSSYHKEYEWSKETNKGFCDAMLKLGYFENKEQIHHYTENSYVETAHAIIKKVWMDTKRNKTNVKKMIGKIHSISREFEPDLIFLGDDNAANYIGNLFLDTETPLVFWGVNNTPVKYGLVDTLEMPGHNVTGVYQTGYYLESLQLLKNIAPGIKTFAILSDNTASGRSHTKKVQFYAGRKPLPIDLVDTAVTNDYEIWQQRALELQERVDAFFIAQYSGLQDSNGKYVSTEEVTEWYLTNIRIPEATALGAFVKQGMLCSANDSGYNQGFEAVMIGHDILVHGFSPAHYSPRAPKRGPLVVNKQRAAMLGLKLSKQMGIEQYIETASALER